jgi:hypothetical protein
VAVCITFFPTKRRAMIEIFITAITLFIGALVMTYAASTGDNSWRGGAHKLRKTINILKALD